MFIDKDERLSRAAPLRRGGGMDGGWQARPPRDWRKPLRLALYLLLSGLALLAALAMWLFPAPPPPRLAVGEPTPPAPIAAPPPLAPPTVSPPTVSPPTVSPPAAAKPAATTPVLPEVAELQAQIRDAAATLAAIRAQAEQARAEMAALHPHGPPADRPAASPARPEPVPGDAHAPALPAPPRPPDRAAASDDAAWVEAERVVQALARRDLPLPAPPLPPPAASPPAAAGPIRPPAPPPAREARLRPGDEAAPDPPPHPLTAPPPPLPPTAARGTAATSSLGAANAAIAATRPRVFLHFRTGSQAGQHLANDIARRLLFSDFAFADASPMPDGPGRPMVRYFHQDDSASAVRLAALLGAVGVGFAVQDLSAYAGTLPAGTLDVWLSP